jgi:amino acid adenylation domain-containing protein
MIDAAPSPQVRVDELIWAQARRSPEATAAVCGTRSLTYAVLERECDRAAVRLCALGIGRGSLVGVHLQRSLEMLVVVLAVMKAGGAYVPLDPDFPAYRLAHIVADAGLRLVVTEATLADRAPPGDYRQVLVADLLADTADGGAPEAAAIGAGIASDLVYVLYTSGSTGMPKGVALEHRNVVNLLLSMQREPGLTALDRLLAVTTLSFDIAGLELYLPLVSGATVVIASRDEAADGALLRGLIDTHGVTVMQATPTTWRLLIEAGWRGEGAFKILCGGEALPRDLASMLLPRCGELWNLYGPTETAIWSTVFRVVDGDAPILIGRPIANTRVYVLDRSGRPVPTGIPGELHIAGAGVARGYLHRPELTAERFVRDPFVADAHGARMYRTGDAGRFLADGNLEFRHRLDHQVKIRGFRVELGDVEAALEAHPAVKQAIAKTFEVGPADIRLVAYVSSCAPPFAEADLRDYLRARLPRYMVPQQFVALDDLPLLPNGKIDRNALTLPRSPSARLLAPAVVEPVDPRVRYLAGVWSNILGTAAGPDGNFFDLGGHSMLAVQMANRVARDTGVRINLIRLGSETLEQIAADLPAPHQEGTPAPSMGRRLGLGLRRAWEGASPGRSRDALS